LSLAALVQQKPFRLEPILDIVAMLAAPALIELMGKSGQFVPIDHNS
jgi:hypothetical protein